jgi:hypothetical protein
MPMSDAADIDLDQNLRSGAETGGLGSGYFMTEDKEAGYKGKFDPDSHKSLHKSPDRKPILLKESKKPIFRENDKNAPYPTDNDFMDPSYDHKKRVLILTKSWNNKKRLEEALMDKYLIDQNTKSVYDVITFFLFLNYQKFSLFHENQVRDFVRTKFSTKQEDLDRNSPQYQNFLKSLYFLKLRDELRQTIVQLHSDILDEFKSSVEDKLITINTPDTNDINGLGISEPTGNSDSSMEDRWELDQKNHQIDQEMARSELFVENIYFPTKYKISDLGQPIEVSKSQGLQMELDLIAREQAETDTDTVLIVP